MKIEKYLVGKFLAEGSYGKVYAVTDTVTNELCVMKLIEDEYRYFAKNEVELLRAIYNSVGLYVPRFKDVIPARLQHTTDIKVNYTCIVMEMIQGMDLHTFIKNNSIIQPHFLWTLMLQLLLCLKYIQQKGVVHNDLKLDNVMIDTDYRVKIIDFGISCFWNRGDYCNWRQGTDHYSAPEMIDYNSTKWVNDHKWIKGRDVWSLGVIMYQMANNIKYPFDVSRVKEDVSHGNISQSHYTLDDGRTNKFISYLLTVDWKQRPTIEEALDTFISDISSQVLIKR